MARPSGFIKSLLDTDELKRIHAEEYAKLADEENDVLRKRLMDFAREIARLREALEKIGAEDHFTVGKAGAMARAALAMSPPTDTPS